MLGHAHTQECHRIVDGPATGIVDHDLQQRLFRVLTPHAGHERSAGLFAPIGKHPFGDCRVMQRINSEELGHQVGVTVQVTRSSRGHRQHLSRREIVTIGAQRQSRILHCRVGIALGEHHLGKLNERDCPVRRRP